MKKILVLAVLALGLSVSSSKAQEGRFYIGTAGLSLFSNDDVKLMTGVMSGDKTSWGLAPEFGYYIKDNVSFGLSIGYTKYSQKGYQDIKMFGVYPYVRYFAYQAERLSVFIEGGLEYLSIEDGVNEMTIGAGPGISYKLSDNFSLNVKYGFVGYQKIKDQKGAVIIGLDASELEFGLNFTF